MQIQWTGDVKLPLGVCERVTVDETVNKTNILVLTIATQAGTVLKSKEKANNTLFYWLFYPVFFFLL